MAIPSGVTTTSTPLTNGKRYEFSHQRLGKLGRLTISGVGTQCLCNAEIAPGEVTDPTWQERFELFEQIVTTCMDALPGKNAPLPPIEEAKRKVAVYRRFINTKHSMDMEQLAHALTEQEYTELQEIIENSSRTALALQDTDSLLGIMQRFTQLHHFRERR